MSAITCRFTIPTDDRGCIWNRSHASRPSHIVCPGEYSTAGYSGSSNIPSRIVSAVRMFRDEFLVHIKEGACPYGA